MWKSIVYKEWIKTRWYLVMLTALGFLILGMLYLKVQHDIVFSHANNYWYFILFNGLLYFSFLKYLPLLIGIAFAFAQFSSEITRKRVKLTFHLPINEDRVMLIMMLFGAGALLASLGSMYIIFWGISDVFFGQEIVHAALVSTLPWFLAGFAAYFLVSTIILEPVWLYRILYAIVVILFIPTYLEDSVGGGYAPINLWLILLTLIISVSLLFSVYRFRKGEM